MGVGEKVINVWHMWPVRAVKEALVQASRPVWERALGASLSEKVVLTLDTELAAQKVKHGVDTIQEGGDKKDSQLRHIGAATVVKGLIAADEQDSDLIVKTAATEAAAKVAPEDIIDSPLIAPQDAEKAMDILSKAHLVPTTPDSM